MQMINFAKVKEIYYTFSRAKELFLSHLLPIYDKQEAEELIFYWFNAKYGWKRAEQRSLLDGYIFSEEEWMDITEAVERMSKGEPIQYIIGFVEFADCKIEVNNSVLIPRPETEELIYEIKSRFGNKKLEAILDICSGSGCIALAMKKFFLEAKVEGIEFSKEAIEVSKRNAQINVLSVDFIWDDVLNPSKTLSSNYDIIVSNPPYISNSERTLMRPNVLDFEPHMALFTGNENDALIFYKAIVSNYHKNLKPDGLLAFEINEKSGKEILSILENTRQFSKIELLSDMQGKDRFIFAVKN